MKKHLFTVLAFLGCGLAASAQTEQGNWIVGGNLELNTAKQYSVIQLSPMAGYFFANNFAGGANIDLSYIKTGGDKITNFGIGPFARYYFGTTNLRPFAHADLSFLTTKSTGSPSETGTQYFLGGGLAAFINRNVALEGMAGYSHTALSGLSGSGGFNLKIGFQVYLSKRQMEVITK